MVAPAITAFGAWLAPPTGGIAPSEAVEVWWLDLAAAERAAVDFSAQLTPAEVVEVSRFRRAEDRRQRTAARWFLRWVLGRQVLGISPAEVRWVRDERGRPHLDVTHAGQVGTAFDFNLSHAGSHVLVAYTGHGRVGVDVEIRTEVETEAMARVCAGDFERAWLAAATDEAENRERFFRLWTMKEAVLKCQGWGLGCDPRHCVLDFEAGSAALQVAHEASRTFRVRTLPWPTPLFGAVATVGTNTPTVRGWRVAADWLARIE